MPNVNGIIINYVCRFMMALRSSVGSQSDDIIQIITFLLRTVGLCCLRCLSLTVLLDFINGLAATSSKEVTLKEGYFRVTFANSK